MRDLIARLEQADGPSRELDAAIALAVNLPVRPEYVAGQSPPYTSSIDAALTLVPEGARWVLYSDGYAYVGPDDEPTAKWCGNTPALALCAAALRARMAQQEARNA